MNAQQAIDLSVAETRTVSVDAPTEDDMTTLQLDCADACDGTGGQYWGTDDAGNTWRVVARS